MYEERRIAVTHFQQCQLLQYCRNWR